MTYFIPKTHYMLKLCNTAIMRVIGFTTCSFLPQVAPASLVASVPRVDYDL